MYFKIQGEIFRIDPSLKLNQVGPHVKIAPQNYENGGKNSNFLKVRSKKWKRISKMIEKCWSDMKK